MAIVDLLVKNIGQLLTMVPQAADGPIDAAHPLGLIGDGAIAIRDGLIQWVGPAANLDAEVELTRPPAQTIDAQGAVVLPGLVDPHTHLVFAGSRHAEFGMRLAGAKYLDILQAGGGILATVSATRTADFQELVESAKARLRRLLAFGVTTCEIKSGYGLSVESEIKMLEVVRQLDSEAPMRLVPTFLGAHAIPPDFRDRPDSYVDLVCNEMLPEVIRRGLASMCDVFLDRGIFHRDQARRILETAQSKSGGVMNLRLHAGQFEDLGGPELAGELKASSVDHLEQISSAGITSMAQAGVVACLLPGAALSLGMRFPHASALRQGGIEVALATDCNPGTSMTENLPLMVTLAATAMGLSIEDALRGVTSVAAKALGLENQAGSIAVGQRADLVIFNVPDYRSLAYHFGVNHAQLVIAGGHVVAEDGMLVGATF